MKWVAGVLVMALLSACGVDGAPIRPELNTGVTISSDGVSVGGAVRVRKGPVTVSVGL